MSYNPPQSESSSTPKQTPPINSFRNPSKIEDRVEDEEIDQPAKTSLAALYEDAPVYPWELSIPWDDYLASGTFTGTFENFNKNSSYCNTVEEFRKKNKPFLDERGVPIKSSRVTFSDFWSNSFVKKVMKNITTCVHLEHYSHVREVEKKDNFRADIDLFLLVDPLWHKQMKIGSQFFCPQQMYNHIPGNINMNFKDTAALTFREYGNLYKGREECFNPWEIMPYTLVLNDKDQCDEFLLSLKKDENPKEIKWIHKKSRYSHNGKGLTVIDSNGSKKMINKYTTQGCPDKESYLAQKYIKNPFLLKGKKFDFRAYMFIASLDPLIILYHDGFLRISPVRYDADTTDPEAYLTNTHISEDFLKSKNMTREQYQSMMEDQGWSYQRFEEFMISEGHVQPGWMDSYVRTHIKKVMFHVVRMNLHKFVRHPHAWEVCGLDFLLDEDMNLWYLELNLSPSIADTSDDKEKVNLKFLVDQVDLSYALMEGNLMKFWKKQIFSGFLMVENRG